MSHVLRQHLPSNLCVVFGVLRSLVRGVWEHVWRCLTMFMPVVHQVLKGHRDEVCSLLMDGEGPARLISGSRDAAVHVWDLRAGPAAKTASLKGIRCGRDLALGCRCNVQGR